MARKKNRKQTVEAKPDYFARIIAILGLLIAIGAIVIPIWQNNHNAQEQLNIRMETDQSGIVLISDDRKVSTVVQIPWLITLSNSGKVKLSITDYDATLLKGNARLGFSHLQGARYNMDGSTLRLPITLDSGESKTIKVYLGFMAEPEVLDNLYSLQEKQEVFTLNESFKYLAKRNQTIYGGVATYREIEGSLTITTDAQFYLIEPVYQLEFRTGRNNNFAIKGSETMARFGS
ncbi:hypothetical protein ACU5EH_06215 [Aliivibrio salmonicida]|uniref:hypothetical protein n=1 Tax=Aliivibrio salmonicida TaxID=40269 RepID=UPI00406C041D